jgi:hypothetical protein
MEYELWAAIVLLFIVAFHTTSGFVGAKMSLVDFAEFQSMPDDLKKLYYSTMTMVAPEAMKTVKADDIKRTADNAMIQIKRAQLPGVNAVPILMPAPTVQGTVDGWKGPMEAVKTTSAPAPKTAPTMPAPKTTSAPTMPAPATPATPKTTSAPATPATTSAPAAPATPAPPAAPAADAKKGVKYLWILLAILIILAGGYVKYKYL